MNGIICIDKPQGHTSFDVIARVRGILHMKKVGHGGTLDPMATGVLPIFLGNATKCCDLLPDTRKCYIAQARAGIETDTQDITGTVLNEGGPRLARAALESAIASMGDGYMQLPPMYSAVRVNGQRLYALARAGKEVKREKRPVRLYRVEILQFDEAAQTFTLCVECSKGTYVRTLCYDLAKSTGAPAALCGLRRTLSAGFTLEDCVTLQQLEQLSENGAADQALIPVERVYGNLPRVSLSPAQTRMILNGVPLELSRVNTQAMRGMVAVYGVRQDRQCFLGCAQADEGQGVLKKVKLFCDRD